MSEIILYYLVAVNITTLLVYGIDKLKAKKSKWRIPESTLLFLAVIGGSIGALLGMVITLVTLLGVAISRDWKVY